MKPITVKLVADGILKKAWLKKENRNWLQAKELQFNAQGIATADLEDAVEYSLSWTLVGSPGEAWTLEVDDPAVYQWKYFSTETWYSTKISLKKELAGAGYTGLRIIKTK